MRRRLDGPACGLPFVLLLVVVLAGGTSAFAKEPPKEAEPPGGLARVYVFYSEPPFDYQLGRKIRIRLASVWDRDKMERKIRKEVAKAGGDVVILERSFMEMDDSIREVVTRGPRRSLKLPTQTAYVEGRVATRIDDDPQRDCERVYAADFETVWNAVLDVVDTLGWQPDTVDTESRYLTTSPVVTAVVTMDCDDETSSWLPAVFTVYVNSYAEESLVRLDVTFVARESGSPTACRSVGVYETTFFRQMDDRLILGR